MICQLLYLIVYKRMQCFEEFIPYDVASSGDH